MKRQLGLYLSYQSSLSRITRSINPKYCGVMKFLADMPSRLGGEDNGTNVA